MALDFLARAIGPAGSFPEEDFVRLSDLYAGLTEEGQVGWLLNGTTREVIASFYRGAQGVLPQGQWDLTKLTPNKFARVETVTSSSKVTVYAGHNLDLAGELRVNDVSLGAGTAPIEFSRVGDTVELAVPYADLADRDLLYQSDSSEIEFGSDLLVAADGFAADPDVRVYVDGNNGIFHKQALSAIVLPQALTLTANQAPGFGPRVLYTWTLGSIPVSGDGGGATFGLVGSLLRNNAAQTRLTYSQFSFPATGGSSRHLEMRYSAPWPRVDGLAGTSPFGAISGPLTNPDPTTLLLHMPAQLSTSPTPRWGNILSWESTASVPQGSRYSQSLPTQDALSFNSLLGFVMGCSMWRLTTTGGLVNYQPTMTAKQIDFGLTGL